MDYFQITPQHYFALDCEVSARLFLLFLVTYNTYTYPSDNKMLQQWPFGVICEEALRTGGVCSSMLYKSQQLLEGQKPQYSISVLHLITITIIYSRCRPDMRRTSSAVQIAHNVLAIYYLLKQCSAGITVCVCLFAPHTEER